MNHCTVGTNCIRSPTKRRQSLKHDKCTHTQCFDCNTVHRLSQLVDKLGYCCVSTAWLELGYKLVIPTNVLSDGGMLGRSNQSCPRACNGGVLTWHRWALTGSLQVWSEQMCKKNSLSNP